MEPNFDVCRSRREPLDGWTHLEGAWAEAAPDQDVQTFQRQTICRKTGRCRRPLFESARECDRVLVRREEPDAGTGPYSARTSYEERPLRHHDARLQTQRHNHIV